MNYRAVSASHGTTGSKSVIIPFTPVGARITVGADPANGVSKKSVGWTDGTNQFCDVSPSWDDRLVDLRDDSGGQIVKARIDPANAPFGTTNRLKYYVDVANANFPFLIEVWN